MDTANLGSNTGKYGVVAIANTATLVTAQLDPLQRKLNIRNTGTVDIYWGFDNLVTSSNGYPLASGTGGKGEAIEIDTRSPIYAITPAGAGEIRYAGEIN